MYYPEDILLDILARLPVKSLKRFRGVCIQWHAVIESTEFIQMHLNRSSLRVLGGTADADQDSSEIPERYRLWAAEEFGSAEKFSPSMKEDWHLLKDFPGRKSRKEDKRIAVVGFCNGLVCIQYSQYGVLVWNPWIKKHWIIPRTRVETELSRGCKRILPHDAFRYGFGYDDGNDDYKVVRIVQLQDRAYQPLGCEVKVFSMRSHLWRRIEDFPYTAFRWYFPFGGGVLANGALHWLLSNYESNPLNSIVAINLTTEKHQLLIVPQSVGFLENFNVVNGHLCVFTDKMWLMQEYGMEDSWTLLDFELPEDILCLKPIVYSASKKTFIFQNGVYEIAWHNENKSVAVQKVNISAPHDFLCWDMFCTVASLVEPTWGGKKKIRCTTGNLEGKDASVKKFTSSENRRPKKRGRSLVSSS